MVDELISQYINSPDLFLSSLVNTSVKNKQLETAVNNIYKKQISKVKRIETRIFATTKEIYDGLPKKIKHKYKLRDDLVEFVNGNQVLSINWHFYKKLLNEAGKSYLIDMYQINDRVYDQDNLSELSDYALTSGITDYRFLVGIQFLYGYLYDPDLTTIKQKITDWVMNDHKPGNEDMFYRYFEEEAIKFYDEQKNTNMMNDKSSISLFDYCSNIVLTSTTGSGYDPTIKNKLDIDFKGNMIEVQNSKFTRSGQLSTHEKIQKCLSTNVSKNNISVKVELAPKIRLIIASDYPTFLKMQFIDQWWNRWMSKCQYSTLYMDNTQLWDMWLSFSKLTNWACPLDQKKFDHKMTKRMVMILINARMLTVKKHCTNPNELLNVFNALLLSISDSKLYYKGEQVATWKSGLLSGWKWTATLGTDANIIENRVADRMLKDIYNINIIPTHFNAQGDDDHLRYNTVQEALAHTAMMRSNGFDINVQKSFISSDHDEYLRKSATNNNINGYPARIINSLLWIYPGDRYDKNIISRMSSFTELWTKLFERLELKRNRAIQYIVDDLKHQKIPMKLIKIFLGTKEIFGGPQLLPTTGKVLRNGKQVMLGKVRIEGKGYQEFNSMFGKYQARELEQWYLKAINLPDVYKGLHIYEDQDMFINDEPEVEPIAVKFIEKKSLPTVHYSNYYPKNVVFGKSEILMHTLFPHIDTFIQMGHAPKSWIYDYLMGHVKTVTPRFFGLSTEFSSLLFSRFRSSIISAMYYRKTKPNQEKWAGLNLYSYIYFPLYYLSQNPNLPKMFS